MYVDVGLHLGHEKRRRPREVFRAGDVDNAISCTGLLGLGATQTVRKKSQAMSLLDGSPWRISARESCMHLLQEDLDHEPPFANDPVPTTAVDSNIRVYLVYLHFVLPCSINQKQKTRVSSKKLLLSCWMFKCCPCYEFTLEFWMRPIELLLCETCSVFEICLHAAFLECLVNM
eukprot:m.194303 g.194303  ORF g.194303 m.194303 type:complete len:174 (-) comp16788_c2_seq6:1338-1859(-)